MRMEWWVGARTPKATTDFLSGGAGEPGGEQGRDSVSPPVPASPLRCHGYNPGEAEREKGAWQCNQQVGHE